MAALNTISLKEFTEIFKYTIENNKRLYDENKKTVAIGIEAGAGIGKTSIVEQLANEMQMSFVKLNLAQLEEVGDLAGYPIKEHYVTIGKDDNLKGKWVSDEIVQSYINKGFIPTGKTRLSYAPPAWLPKENPNGCILLLDDYTRATNIFMQATMELIDRGEYFSWKLPKYTTIVLSSNPDDGSYSVSSLDIAQKTRFINFNVQFDVNIWAEWAEYYGLRNEAINFALLYPEIFKEKDGVMVANPRCYVNFCNCISGIDDWSNTKSLATILTIAKGCFVNDPDNTIGTFFTTFISNKLDKLISPEDMLFEDWDKVSKRVKACVYTNNDYRAEIASVLTQRLLNYICMYFDTKGNKSKPVEDRLIDFISSDVQLFGEDHIFYVIKTLINKYKNRLSTLLLNPKVQEKLLR